MSNSFLENTMSNYIGKLEDEKIHLLDKLTHLKAETERMRELNKNFYLMEQAFRLSYSVATILLDWCEDYPDGTDLAKSLDSSMEFAKEALNNESKYQNDVQAAADGLTQTPIE